MRSELGRVGVFSPGIARIPDLAALLGAERIVFRPGSLRRCDVVVGWGRKPNTKRARRYAAEHGVPFLALEDGFLRSVGLGVEGDPPLSIVVDDLGIYYDATAPSRLEAMLAEEDLSALIPRARSAIDRILDARLSKYNHAPDISLADATRPRVLVVDQTAGDLSVRLGGARGGAFDAMLAAALRDHPDAEVIVKTHPDVASGKRRGHFDPALVRGPRVRLLGEACNPISLLQQIERVYTVTSLLGFEALMVGKPVTCFGAPFYAGWGVTEDRGEIPSRRGRSRSVEEIFAAAYLRYARYVDPETGERCELERVIEHLALQKRAGDDAGTSTCIGFSVWKRGFLKPFLAGPGVRVIFARDASRAARTAPSRIVVWGTREGEDVRALATSRGVPLWRMEDGFLRSVGLGTDLDAPASLVVDRAGIYYDPRTASDLERILADAVFEEQELARARALREAITKHGISKYNVGARVRVEPPDGDRRAMVLVVGQVEEDASIRLGCVDVRRNQDLLRAARAARPDAYLVYKPHPDVVSGNRRDSLPLEDARRYCDAVVTHASLSDCLRHAREVHTMTSLVGFEALLRGIRVTVYGQPFYAGWGLTEDRHPHPRRTRRLALDELVCGALIQYPRYVHPRTRCYTTPEAIVSYLASAKTEAAWQRVWPLRQAQKIANLAKVVLRAS